MDCAAKLRSVALAHPARIKNETLFRAGKFALHRKALIFDEIDKLIWHESIIQNGNNHSMRELIQRVGEQMQTLNSSVCVPAYYRDHLLAILLIGEKKDGEAALGLADKLRGAGVNRFYGAVIVDTTVQNFAGTFQVVYNESTLIRAASYGGLKRMNGGWTDSPLYWH